MSSHKIPSNLDAEEKLVGFLSLKQFLFVLGGFALGFIAYTLAKASFFLALPFLPFIIALFVLGLYQRPDQPVEVFLLSWIRFKMRPKVRIWNQEGYEQHVIVTAPKKEVIDYTKGLRHSDILNKFQAIGQTLDTRGWSTKGVLDDSGNGTIPTRTERLLNLEEEYSNNIRADYIQPQLRTEQETLTTPQSSTKPAQNLSLEGNDPQYSSVKQDTEYTTPGIATPSETQSYTKHINLTDPAGETTFSLR
jgi:hypothetical protein